jgi:hypothetical protein
MQGTSFVVMTGHLNDYPLSNLIGILRRQRKTGRLLVEYPTAPCSFFFENGDLVDARLNTLNGLQAVFVALAQPNAPFNFNPLIQPPQRSIDGSAQQVLLESLGCWEEKVINAQAGARDEGSSLQPAPLAQTIPQRQDAALPEAKVIRALPPASPDPKAVLKREVFTASALILSLLGLLAVVAFTGWPTRRETTTAPPTLRVKNTGSVTTSPYEITDSNATTVQVVVQIEDGRVSQAFIARHQPGMEAYEALALRIARARRYPAGMAGREAVSVEINSPLK